MLARVLAVIVRLSVHPSVCLSHAGIVSKRINVGSRKQCHVIAQGLWFSGANSRWWGAPISPEISDQSDSPPIEHYDFDHYPFIAPQSLELGK